MLKLISFDDIMLINTFKKLIESQSASNTIVSETNCTIILLTVFSLQVKYV